MRGLVFVRMALRNVGRNWNRTGMMILGMLVASAIMTLSLSFSAGYSEGHCLAYRRMVGADILIYPNRYIFGGPEDGVAAWEWRRLSPDEPVDALYFHRDLVSGYLSPATDPPETSFRIGDLPGEVRKAEKEIGDILSIAPGRLLRAFVVLEDGPDPERLAVTLRGRDIETDLAVYDMDAVASYRQYFRPSQDESWVAFLNDVVAGELPPNGSRLVVEVPSIVGEDDRGTPIYDYSRPLTFYFMVYGRYRLETGPVRLENAPPERTDLPKIWPVAIDEPEVWIPEGTFNLVYTAARGEPQGRTGQLRVVLESMARAKEVAGELARRLPWCAVVTVPQEVRLSGIRYRARVTSEDPLEISVTRDYSGRGSLTLDVKTQVAAMSFVVAGILVAANMFILVTQRRREIGVLKALGAARRDVLVLFLTEALGYALAGSILGFAIVKVLTLPVMMGSPMSTITGALLTLKAAGVVLGATVGLALAFGFGPAWQASRTPPAGLLGD